MPANLNALIRYKTIDLCLSNRHRQWTIKGLMVACSEALSEHRGMNTGVSERTLRDDIRVMRSNILGFNAPIKQRNGLYFYSDPSFSIFRTSAVKKKLLKRILAFLLEIRAEMDHPELEIMIGKLAEIIPVDEDGAGPDYESLEVDEKEEEREIHGRIAREAPPDYSDTMHFIPSAPEKSLAGKKRSIPSLEKTRKMKYTFSWRDVLNLI